MGILDFISKQFIDVIQWTADEPGVLASRFPMSGMEIQNGAQLVVRETQKAAFFNEGAGYLSRAMPHSEVESGDYDHLARVREWSAIGGDDDGGGE